MSRRAGPDAATGAAGEVARRPPAPVGIGLRQPHYAALFETLPDLGFVEVHSENFFADGGAALAVLREARSHYPVSLHGVGLALGSAAGLDPWHLERLARLVARIEPVRVSDHACFARAAIASGAPVVHANDLLPIAFTDESLAIMVANVLQVQERIGRQMLVENLSSYVSFADAPIAEPAFFAQLCARTGCGLLLDLNNLMVNALNAGAADPLGTCRAFVDALPVGVVGEIHLAGYADTGGGRSGKGGGQTGQGAAGMAGGVAGTAGAHAGKVDDSDDSDDRADRAADDSAAIVIDDHGSRVRPAVWALYEHALRRLGPVPTLVEWDTDLPAFDVLLDEAAQAAAISARTGA